MKLNGAHALVECLLEQGVDTVFGYPGGSVLYIYDALYDSSRKLRHIRTAHEQGAVHAADGYARSTGRVGVVIATSGPGATNLVTGIATAWMDSVPLVLVTGNVPLALIGRDSFQEIDITGVTMPITKHNFIVREAGDLVPMVREAFKIAQSGRKGPVLVDIPKDMSAAFVDYSPAVPQETEKALIASPADILRAAKAVAEAERPFIYAGGGTISAGAGTVILQLAERIQAPVALSLMGLGLVPTGHPLLTGMIGMHGSRASNQGVCKADLLIVAGARFSDRVVSNPVRFAPGAKILHLDIDPTEIGKNLRSEFSLLGDMRANLESLLDLLPQRRDCAWSKDLDSWRLQEKEDCRRETAYSPRSIMAAIWRFAGEDALITTEVGQHQMWTGQYYPFSKPRQFLTSGGLGTMGFGTGAAIGAQIGNPGRRVVHIAGDGSFRMNLTELGTIAAYRLPIVIVLINNGVLGMVRQWQSRFYDSRYSATTLDASLDFVKLSGAFGIPAWRAVDTESLSQALESALKANGPALIDCVIREDEEVLPMVPAGRDLDEQIFREDPGS